MHIGKSENLVLRDRFKQCIVGEVPAFPMGFEAEHARLNMASLITNCFADRANEPKGKVTLNHNTFLLPFDPLGVKSRIFYFLFEQIPAISPLGHRTTSQTLHRHYSSKTPCRCAQNCSIELVCDSFQKCYYLEKIASGAGGRLHRLEMRLEVFRSRSQTRWDDHRA
jgi:hypothetical protein